MLEAGGGTVGLFPRHRPDPGSIAASAEPLSTSSTGLSGLVDDVARAHRPAITATVGTLAQPMATVPVPLQRSGTELSGAAMVAHGAVVMWVRHVVDHDDGIDDINRRWSSASAGDFGVAPSAYDGDETPEERQLIDRGRSNRVTAARSLLLEQLTREREALLDDLDADAQQVAGLLDEGPTDRALTQLLVAGALPPQALHLLPNLTLSAAQRREMLANLRSFGLLAQYAQPASASSADLEVQLDLLRSLGVHPSDYRDLLQTYWVTVAAEKAGIDLSAWDPSRGAFALEDIIERVYTYYGDLYLDNDWMQWAGMANMIGPTFASGFFDLSSIRDFADRLGERLDDLPPGVRELLPGHLRRLADLGGDLTANDLEFFEQTFLQMQKDIFVDQAASHEAYLGGGMEAIEEMQEAGLFDNGNPDATVQAWQNIDDGRRSGDEALVTAGNEYLLYREQHDIIEGSYQHMKDHPVTGLPLTYFMGAIGGPSIPGAQTLAEHDPFTVTVTPSNVNPVSGLWDAVGGPLPRVHVDTPLPDGNLADFDTRWDLIANDTLPAYQELLAEDPELAREIIGSDIAGRIDDYRLLNRLDEIEEILLNWDVRVSVE